VRDARSDLRWPTHAAMTFRRCVGSAADRRCTVGGRALPFEAVAATLKAPWLTSADIGRRLAGEADLHHRINRADRPLDLVGLLYRT
jgi:hypothetical protein